MPVRPLRRHVLPASLALAAAVLVFGACARRAPLPPQGLLIQNPYAGVNWAGDGRYKVNFHTHTTGSDGNLTPTDVIDRYQALGYSILALTDHNAVTFPWERLSTNPPSEGARKKFAEGKLESKDIVHHDRDPAALGMVAIQGCELSVHHHTGSFFNDHSGSETEEESLDLVTRKGGLAMLNHPGRYKKSVDWYVALYQAYPVLFGLEVYNQGDRYPGDRKTWDAILGRLMPDRPVWGYSNDDMHTGTKLGRNWNILLLPELSADWVRRGMVEGRSYFVYAPAGHDGPKPPAIEDIAVDNRSGTIRIRASACTNILWISEGRAIHQGDTFVLAAAAGLGRYVRAELQGLSNTVAGTQPFAIVRPVRTRLDLDAQPGRVVYPDAAHVQARLTVRNLSDRPVAAGVVIRLADSILGRQPLALAPGAETVLPLAVPLEAINQGKTLDIETELGPEYGAFSLVLEQHPLAVALPVALTASLPSTRFARIRLGNTMKDRPATVRLTASCDGQPGLEDTITLAPAETAARHVRLPADAAHREVVLRAVAEFDPALAPVAARLDARLDSRQDQVIPRLAKPVRPDGSLADWGAPVRVLDQAADVFPDTRRERWAGPEDQAAALFWGWDGEALCLAAKVRDDAHANTKSGDALWNGDCLQLALVPEDGEAVNVALALTPDGVTIHQWKGPELNLTPGVHAAVVRREADHTTYYEARIPLASLGLPPQPGMRLGFAAVLFDDDTGQGHKDWMQTAPGLAGGWAPETLPRFHLGS